MADTVFFENSRFGMFIHFGLYSMLEGVWNGRPQGRNCYAEWIRYQGNWPHGIPADEYNSLAGKFDPRFFDADAWIGEAKNAGMKYVIPTAKHHDGFSMWDTAVSDFNIVKATPFKRDWLAELRNACKRHGLVFGAYYSHWQDWEHPGGGKPHWPEIEGDPAIAQPSQAEFDAYFNGKCIPQVIELIEKYQVGILWFDTWRESPFLTPERIRKLIQTVRNTNAGCLINSRIGTTWNFPDGNSLVDFISMGDNVFPDETINSPWETSCTFNHSWGVNRTDYSWKTAEDLLKKLITNASRNGNFQLNIGPDGNGRIPVASLRRLREIGAWMSANGESVYCTGPSSIPEPAWGRLTVSKNDPSRLFAHVFENSSDVPLELKGAHEVPVSASILETGQAVRFFMTDGTLCLEMPEESAETRLNVVDIRFK